MPTGKQKFARSLEKAGYSHAEIARQMGLKNRESATRLLLRAKAAEAAVREAVQELMGDMA